MIKNYILLAFRSWNKNRLVNVLNFSGLIIGISACLLILQYTDAEKSYDHFHKDKDRIYRVGLLEYEGGESSDLSATNYYGVGETLAEELPEIESYSSIHDGEAVVSYQDKRFSENKIFYVEPNFLEFFGYPVINADLDKALKSPDHVLLTDEMAMKYFGSEDPIGKSLTFNNKKQRQVVGVIRSPVNSHFQFDFLINNQDLLLERYRKDNGIWRWSNFYMYVKTDQVRDPELLQRKYAPILDKFIEEGSNVTRDHILQPIDKIYLHSDLSWEMGPMGNYRMIQALFIIAFLIVGIAMVNFINLSTVYAGERAKEVGIRKVTGASKNQLIAQFMLQSFVFCLIAFSLSIGLIFLFQAAFSELVGKAITHIYTLLQNNWIEVSILFLIGVVLSGIYPALVISNYQPIQVLKGRFTDSGKGLYLRKLLTVFQFTISIALLIGTIMVYKQLHFMQNQELGFSTDQVLVVEGPQISDSTFYMKANSFKESLESTGNISQVSLSNSTPSREVAGIFSGFRRKEVDPNSSVLMAFNRVDQEYFSLYDMEIVAGRNFDKELDNWQSVILNEMGALGLGYRDAETAIGRQMAIGSGNENSFNIVGVVRDYHHNSLNQPMTSLCHFYAEHNSDYISLKLNSRDLEHSINRIKSEYAAFFPGNPFHYFFMDDSFAAQYEADRKTGEIVLLFSSLAIFIACLGLFGLTSFVVIKRAKEIGIRKVLGATFLNIFNLISKEFVFLVGISIVIASPLSYFLLEQYLEQYPYQTEISWWIFVLAGLVALVISILTMSYQSVRSASANPIDSIRTE